MEKKSLYAELRFPVRLRRLMERGGYSYRVLAMEVGVSAPTLHRVASGGVPDVETFLVLQKWLGRRGLK